MTQESNALFCPLQELGEFLERKWSFQIIYEIGNHKMIRFNELQDELKYISPKTLSDTLKKLKGGNLVCKKQFEQIPPKVEYSLTEEGLSLYPIIVDLLKWSISRKTTIMKHCLCHCKPDNIP